jgi:hypothetical protein
MISDLQAAGLGADARLPDAVELEVRAVDGALPANLAILAAWREAGAPQRDGGTLLRVRVANTGGAAGAATLRMAVDGLAAAEQALELAPGQRRDLALAMFPAADRATRVQLQLDPGDALPVDDARFLVLAPPRVLDVLLLRDDAGGDGYLEAAMALSRDPILRSDTVTAREVTAQRIARADAIVLDGATVPDDAVLRALDARVAQGAGLLAFAGAGGVAAAALPQTTATVEPGARGTLIGAIAHNHPLARSLGSARLDGVRVWRHRAVQAHGDDAVLARYADGSAALIERVHGNGRSLLFTTSPARGWSDLAVDPVFVPLLLESLGYLTGTLPAPAHYAPGSVLDTAAHVTAAARGGQLAKALAADEAIWLRTPAGDARRVRALQPLHLDEPGFHELRADDGALLPVAVSVVSTESSLHALSAQDFLARVRRYPQPQPPRVPAAGSGREDDTLARALLLLAAGLLLAEGAFAARVTRLRPAAQAGA